MKVEPEVSSYPGQSVTLRCAFADPTEVQLTMVREQNNNNNNNDSSLSCLFSLFISHEVQLGSFAMAFLTDASTKVLWSKNVCGS